MLVRWSENVIIYIFFNFFERNIRIEKYCEIAFEMEIWYLFFIQTLVCSLFAQASLANVELVFHSPNLTRSWQVLCLFIDGCEHCHPTAQFLHSLFLETLGWHGGENTCVCFSPKLLFFGYTRVSKVLFTFSSVFREMSSRGHSQCDKNRHTHTDTAHPPPFSPRGKSLEYLAYEISRFSNGFLPKAYEISRDF